ncbi:MAG: hypothetical protein JXR52_02800 [Bacteroidales bacterium]|nr:hypothetical protein [Bacteroidales bacterium]MBN2697729.1 hypothetical protein [Bacteroidales bacterium]
MKRNIFPLRGLFLLTSVNLLLFTACSVIPDKKPDLFQPAGSVQLADNMPVLSWQPVKCGFYRVWVDGAVIDSVPADRNRAFPFPLSYGAHQWFVEAVDGKRVICSDTARFIIHDQPLSTLPEGALLLREDWQVCSSLLAGKDGSALSREKVDTAGWKSSSIPATVLSVLVRNGTYPNPYVGLNNMKIPDCSDAFNEEHDLLKYSHLPGKNPWKEPYWYRREFKIPGSYRDRKVWLNIGEINYRADVWLNGKQIADRSVVVGMERSFRFDITGGVNFDQKNILVIAVYPPDHPGKPAPPPLTPLADPGTNMADGMISKDYTKWDALGWDWVPAVRDRDMGITEDVVIYATDFLEIDNLYITSDLPLPDTSRADLTFSLDLINHSGHTQNGNLRISILKESLEISLNQPFALSPYDTLQILWDSSNKPQLQLDHPKLWWPNGYGSPELYTLKCTATTDAGEQSGKTVRFGIREVDTYVGCPERVYRINGKQIYCRGGNWVPDMTLNWTATRYRHEIELTRRANLNMLRIWGPAGAPPEVFYDAADENGIMLWQDFLNDYWGTFKNTPGYRPEESLFREATISMVKKYRNHPSLVIWGSGNEGPNPREELIMKHILPVYDGRDSKHYLKISNGDGLHGGGPYHTIAPEDYFTDPKLNGFSSEIGPSGVPVFESVTRFMPDPGKEWIPGRFPIDGVWAYHDANNWPGSDLRKFSSYDNLIRSYYGSTDSASIKDVEAYLNRCQLLNHDVYRACIESINSQLWTNSSGILLWKSNASWPSLTWQIYDWYLQAHAGYYGVKKAFAPVSVYYNRKTGRVEVLKTSPGAPVQSRIEATLYNAGMTPVWSFSESRELFADSVLRMAEAVPVQEKLCFLKLKVEDERGNELAGNFYWLKKDHDFRSLESLPEPKLRISSRKEEADERVIYTVTITNTGRSIAFMTRFKLTDSMTGQEILPSFWSDNFISLIPGETRIVQVEAERSGLPDGLVLTCRSYNMNKPEIHRLK